MSNGSPGISFEAPPPPQAETLPRMDIAGFVGFAEQGPIGIPVPIEDSERFRNIFGGPVELARDEETGRIDTSYLLSAVDAFFRNGGRRCWVVRVGKPLEKHPRSRYEVPGLVRPFPGEGGGEESSLLQEFAPAVCRARSQGSGFDEIRVGTVLCQRMLPDGDIYRISEGESEHGSPWGVHWSGSEGVPEQGVITEGELLRLAFGSEGYPDGALRYMDGAFRPVPIQEVGRKGDAGDRVVQSSRVQAFQRGRSPMHDPSLDHEEWTVDGQVLAKRGAPPVAKLDGATLRRREEEEGFVFTLISAQNPDDWDSGPWRVSLTIRSPAPYKETVLFGVLRDEEGELLCVLKETEHRVRVSVPEPDVSEDPWSEWLFLRCQLTDAGRSETYVLLDARADATDTDGAGQGEESDDLDDVLTSGTLVRIEEKVSDQIGWFHLGSPTSRTPLNAGGEEEKEEDARVLKAWTIRDHRWPISPEALPSSAESIARLRMDLLTWQDRELVGRIEQLGFTEQHPRGWMNLPTDDTLFGFEEAEPSPPKAGTLSAEVYAPRPALAGPTREMDLWLPMGMAGRPDASRTRGRRPDGTTRLERDGVSRFRPELFVDEDLASAPTAELPPMADEQTFLKTGTLPRGLHSLWPVREVTLLSLPDIHHRDWTEKPKSDRDRMPDPIPIPQLGEVRVRDGNPLEILLSWSLQTEEEYSFELQESIDPAFTTPTEVYTGEEMEAIRYVRSDQAQVFYFRVRALSDGKSGGWSVTRRVEAPEPDFASCVTFSVAPSVRCPEEGIRDDAIEFDPLENEPQNLRYYEVQFDSDPAFPSPRTVDRPRTPEEGEFFRISLGEQLPALSYARVRAVAGLKSDPVLSPWSCTVVLKRPLPRRRVLVSPREYDQAEEPEVAGRDGLLRVQRSALRFAAARGDMLAVLGLPEQDEGDQVHAHVRRLTTLGSSSEPYGGRLGHDEERTLSFGALYHPWQRHSMGTAPGIQPVPPDGPITGLFASQALARGAWFPPANVELQGTRTLVSLRADPSDLPDRLNLLRESPRGVLTLDASTLASDLPLRPIPTRRTLSLVRRLVVREGPELVFEEHGPQLRRRIAEQFDSLLRRLFERGALAGSRPAEAYRVVTDDSVNPPARREQGELVVELRIAPSRPLEFITVRLVQRGPGARALAAA